MVVDSTVAFPDVDATAGPDPELHPGPGARVHSTPGACRSTLLGNDQFANMFLVGAAFQTGALPLPARAIEAGDRAERRARSSRTSQAFRRGRRRVADPAAFAQAAAALSGAGDRFAAWAPARRLIESVAARPARNCTGLSASGYPT